MVKLTMDTRVPPSWPSASIVDARAFRIGESELVHRPTHASSNRIRAACGITAPIIQSDRPCALWADSYPTCPTCKERS